MASKKEISKEQEDALIEILKERFLKNKARHKEIDWEAVEMKIRKGGEKLWSLEQMEASGGEPDVVGYDEKEKAFIFFDCSAESPKERRSFCYDRQALDARKANKPEDSVVDVATEMGIELLSEQEYRYLQSLGNFDTKTSSWVKTPPEVRKLGGALFCDKRYAQVFLYHNGADSYYAARGFRGSLKL